MKSAILTFHESNNVGALLQAYALQEVLSKLCGHPCDIINYHSKYKEKQYSNKINKNFMVYLNRALSKNIQDKIKKKADCYKNTYLNITEKRFNSSKELEVLNEKYDYFFCGSDQVWNAISTGADSVYFLDFVKDSSKIVSYAPSIALAEIPEGYKHFYMKNINRFKYLSIREKSGQKLIKELTGKNAQVVLDPTLLIDGETWRNFAKFPNQKKPYIFVYYISFVPELIKFVKKLQKETGYEVIVSIKTVRDKFVGFTGKILSPEEFVGYIANAEYVVTNSFHGTAFSVNLGKNFYSFGNKKSLAKVNSRVTDFLDLLDLTKRFIEIDEVDNALLPDLNNKIDYTQVFKLLSSERVNSINYIKQSIGLM